MSRETHHPDLCLTTIRVTPPSASSSEGVELKHLISPSSAPPPSADKTFIALEFPLCSLNVSLPSNDDHSGWRTNHVGNPHSVSSDETATEVGLV